MKLKFTEDKGQYRKGDVADFTGSRGEYFLRRGVAKKFVPKRVTKEEKSAKKTK